MSPANQLDALVSLITSSVDRVKAEYERLGYDVPDLNSVIAHPLDASQPSLDLKQAIQTIEGACAQLSVLVTPPQHTVTNRGFQFFEPACYNVVVEAKLADLLVNHPNGLHVSELSKKTGIEAGKLARIMRFLATRHVFREVNEDVFANNRLSMMLVSSHGLHDLMGHFSDDIMRSSLELYSTLTDPVLGPSYEANKTCFNQMSKCPGPLFVWYNEIEKEKGARFGRGMLGWGQGIGAGALLTGFPWKDLPKGTKVNDVGGGVGNISLQLAEAFPQLHIVLQDLDGTIEQAKGLWQEKAPKAIEEQRVDFVPFDFFKDEPVKDCDIYYLKNIIHDWPDADCEKILRNVKASMKPSSRVVVHEYVLQHLNRTSDTMTESAIPSAPEPLLPNYGEGRVRQYYLDMDMMVMLNSKERTLQDFIELGEAVGLQFVKMWDFGETSAVEYRLA